MKVKSTGSLLTVRKPWRCLSRNNDSKKRILSSCCQLGGGRNRELQRYQVLVSWKTCTFQKGHVGFLSVGSRNGCVWDCAIPRELPLSGRYCYILIWKVRWGRYFRKRAHFLTMLISASEVSAWKNSRRPSKDIFFLFLLGLCKDARMTKLQKGGWIENSSLETITRHFKELYENQTFRSL